MFSEFVSRVLRIRMIRAAAFALFFMYSVPSNSQDELVLFDSLVDLNAFPVFFSRTEYSVIEVDKGKLQEVYTYKRDDGRTDVKYLLSSNRKRNLELNIHPLFLDVGNNCFSLGRDSVVYVPPVHLAFAYARTFRRKSEGYRNLNFFVDHFVENYADSTWRTSDYRTNLKFFNGDSLLLSLKFGPQPHRTNRPEGMVSTGRNQLDLLGIFETWSHFHPKFYRYSIEVLDENGMPYEYYTTKIGFRDVRVEKNRLFVNNVSVPFKAIELNPDNVSLVGANDYLQELKVHNFNSIVLEQRGTKDIYNFCDSAGFNVVQVINEETFATLQELLEFFVSFKGHPSFVAWMDTGLDANWLKILKRLDHARPVIKQDRLLYPTINNWDNLDSVTRAEVKNRFQIFRLYYVPDACVLNIDLQEHFDCTEHIGIKWTIEEDHSIKDQGCIDTVPAEKGISQVLIPTKITERGAFSYYFEIVVREDCFPFRANDVIAIAKFQFVKREGKLSYEVVY